MSSSDIFDVLNIKPKSDSPKDDITIGKQASTSVLGDKTGPNTSSTGGSAISTMKSMAPKPQVTGIQRELYNLLGENQPPIMVQPVNRFKEKMAGKPSPWTYSEFWSNDDKDKKKRVKLRHWVKGSKELIGDVPQVSSFSKFSQRLTLPQFTKDEYQSFMNAAKERVEHEKSDASTALQPKNKVTTGKSSGEKTPKTDSAKETSIDKQSATAPETNSELADKDVNSNTTNDELTKNDDDEHPKESIEKKKIDDDKEAKDIDQGKNEWSFEEVEYLFQLCRKYDLRWFIIHDRYQFDSPEHRSLEDLKSKFYEICQNYFAVRNSNDPLLQSLNYNKEKEVERKQYLQRLLSRSAAEIAEEEALIIESKKFEMAAKKTLNERESLLRLLDSPNSDQNVSQYMTSQGISQLYNNLLADKSRKRKNDSSIPENPWMKQQQQFAQQKQQLQQLHEKRHSESSPSGYNHSNGHGSDSIHNTPSLGKTMSSNESDTKQTSSPRKTKRQKQEMQNLNKRKGEAQYAEQLLQDFTTEERKALGVIAHGEKLSPGVYLRSTKISTFKPALQNRVIAILQELGLPMRPSMPSYDVIDVQEELLKHVVTLLDLKKQLDRVDAEKAIRK